MIGKTSLRYFSALIFVVNLSAQVDRASLSGTITDSTGSVMANVKIEAVAADTGFRRETITSSSGTFQIPSLPVGSYAVTVSHTGFRSAEFKSVELVVGQNRTLD